MEGGGETRQRNNTNLIKNKIFQENYVSFVEVENAGNRKNNNNNKYRSKSIIFIIIILYYSADLFDTFVYYTNFFFIISFWRLTNMLHEYNISDRETIL